MELLELPIEVLKHMATFLDAKSLASLNQTCKALYSISSIETLWQGLCEEDHSVSSNIGWNLTFRQIYTKILHPYPILGFHRLALQPFGGLVHIWWAEGEIKVNRIFPGHKSSLKLVSEPTFSLTWNHNKDCLDVSCVSNLEDVEKTSASISKSRCYFVLQCEHQNCYKKHKRTNKALGQSDKGLPEGFVDHPGAFKSFKLYKGYSCPLLPFTYSPIPNHFPFTPGLYKGDYGGHGVEMIQVRPCDLNPNRAECLKISGDPNVPAGNISVTVHLDKPVILPEEKQNLIEEILDADRERSDQDYRELFMSNDNNPDLRQPFALPLNCFERNADPPDSCLGRYIGEGRIAGHNFHNPSLCRLHVVKFDADRIGVLWLDLCCFMMMYRVTQSFGEGLPFQWT